MIIYASDGYLAAVPALSAAVYDSDPPIWKQSPSLAPMIAIELWDMDAYSTITGHLVEAGRLTGSPMLRIGLAMRAMDAVTTGDPGGAPAAARTAPTKR
jgi:hypothetical protein